MLWEDKFEDLRSILNPIDEEIDGLYRQKASILELYLSDSSNLLRDRVAAWMEYGECDEHESIYYFKQSCPITWGILNESMELNEGANYDLFEIHVFEDLLERFEEHMETEADLIILEEWMNANIDSFKNDW